MSETQENNSGGPTRGGIAAKGGPAFLKSLASMFGFGGRALAMNRANRFAFFLLYFEMCLFTSSLLGAGLHDFLGSSVGASRLAAAVCLLALIGVELVLRWVQVFADRVFEKVGVSATVIGTVVSLALLLPVLLLSMGLLGIVSA